MGLSRPRLRVALGQAPSTPGDLPANLDRAAALVGTAAAAGARVLALPELYACGYAPASIAADPDTWSLAAPPTGGAPAPGTPLAALAAAAADAGVWVLLGAAVADPGGGQPCNALLVLDPGGRVRGRYAKSHLWREERATFAPGTGLVLIEDGGVRIGLGICYDAGFPELTRAYARAGAHAVLFASAFATGHTEYRYGIYHPARAVENTLCTLVVNAVGDIAGEHYFGRSGAWGPDGRPLARCADDVADLCVVDIAPHDIATARDALPYLTDLRTDLFGPAPCPLPITISGASYAPGFSRS
ncbi:carbon-nitrogen hydrolase family protein [Streptomyces malaysiensis]|uniref:Nitrilase/cyanide hydratase and apolipoprotein N-acyltransferase n=1 Tax=Streptomyces malaysiensis TaxID=92644 RepID=A0A7X5XBH2_STRMQ|nr:carbon-nitrogen hydrolase family protein [Streptomyces malaysiensis]NIY69400.1 nitrilase/cyanide hydratase and apolipoprotein N-acyltransferase [Streptomyces malaysiensis]